MSTSGRGWGRTALTALLAAALALPLAGCGGEEEEVRTAYEPSSVEQGTAEGKVVTFTQEAAARVDLQMQTSTASGAATVVDYASLIYDGKGVPWVYQAFQPLVFQRTKVVVHRIEGDRVLLTGGLAAGTSVVTVGAAEVYGAELDIAGSH